MKLHGWIFLILTAFVLSGCNVSPLSPSNKPRINNNGEIGEIKNNQNGIMAEIANLKSRLDVVARDVENLQNGLINSNNKNFGIQIFQGDGGLAVGLTLLSVLGFLAINYKIKSDKYKKTAEIFGKKIREMNNPSLENEVFTAALANKVEADVYRILKK